MTAKRDEYESATVGLAILVDELAALNEITVSDWGRVRFELALERYRAAVSDYFPSASA